MNFETGQMLGHYRLIEKLGEGGMGIVWKALDTTLDREVAIKVLTEAFAEDPERLARFEREAKLLASLSHPGIATIHGLDRTGGVRFLAMELVPGQDLAKRLIEGPIPIDEALAIALRVAEALEAAHNSGIIHRDLKPANIQLMPDGKIKILDFGLAKALDPDGSGGAGSSRASLSPTMTTPAMTRAGVIFGTAAYMSPEQAKGKPLDRRVDIWAFGCILYEMLAGRRTFRGDGVSELIAAVIMAPVEFQDLPANIPARVRALLRRCLEKDPRRRLSDMGEARFSLEETLSGAAEESTAASVSAQGASPTKLRLFGLGAAAAAAMVTAGLFWFLMPRPPEPPMRRFEIPSRGPFRSSQQGRVVAISPDGRMVAHLENGKLVVRNLARLESTEIATASEPILIAWSPDSTMISYAASGKLWKVPASGGESTHITDLKEALTGGSGMTWCPDGKIILSTGESGLFRVSALGGEIEEYLPLDKATESDLHDPECLPDGSVLFVPHSSSGRPSSLVLFAGGKKRVLLKVAPDQDVWFPTYSPTGHILYRRQPVNAGLWAVPFSLKRHEVTGEPFLVAPDADVPSVSTDGTLVHVKGAAIRLTQMVWMERGGKILGTVGEPQDHWPFPELSPNGQEVAIAAKDGDVDDIWIHDVERGTRTRLGASGTVIYSPLAWTPDAKGIVYCEGAGNPLTLKSKAADGSGEAKTFGIGWSPSYSADGRYLLFAGADKQNNWDLFYVDKQGDGKPAPLLTQEGIQLWPRLSPDGHYFAYTSDENGADEVYLKRFPSGEGKWRVSVAGGLWPRWSRHGNHLYYVNGEDLMEVDVTLGPEPRLGKPRLVLTRRPLGRVLIFGWPPGFDVSPQDDRFLVVQPVGGKEESSGIIVFENWTRAFARPGI